MEYYNDGDYSKATSYLKTASLTSKGKTNLELKMALYECYYKLEDYDSAIETLKDILSYDDEYNKAITALARKSLCKVRGWRISYRTYQYI